jgi:enoyl-CoA hydratase/carnithine racemase
VPPVTDYETITYVEDDGIGWVTLNRPEVLNAFNQKMRQELQSLWREMRWNDDVRVVVLTGAGERAFCTGIDREETMDPARQQAALDAGRLVDYPTPWTYDDPGFELGPKTNDMWKPVIVAVNGMACGGAFYMLGEAEFIIAADHATFFDPHVTVGMISGYETVHMLPKMPFGELARMVLLGSAERMSAQRAYEIGLVTEVVPGAELHERVEWAARTIADLPELGVQGTVRALWAGLEFSRRQAIEVANFLCRIGSDPREMIKAQERFTGGRRTEWRLR